MLLLGAYEKFCTDEIKDFFQDTVKRKFCQLFKSVRF